MSALTIGTIATVVHAVVTSSFSAFVALLVFGRREAPVAARATSDWTVLRPVEAISDATAARFAAEARDIHPLRTVVCAGVMPARAAADALMGAGVDLVIDTLAEDAPLNRKTAHLAAATRHARAQATPTPETTFVQVDADVQLRREDLDALAGALEAARIDDIAFAVPAPSNEPRWGARALRGILRYSPQSFAVVDALSRVTGGAPAVAGKCVAIRASTLARIGGYESIASAIADDVALVERVAAVGGRAIRSPRAAAIDVADVSLADAHARMTRWLRVIRGHRPHLLLTYPALVAPLGVTAALAITSSLSSPADSAWVAMAFALAWGTRVLLAASLARGAFRDHVTPIAEVPVAVLLGDLVLTSALLRAAWSGRITWRGRVYDVDARGDITAVRASTS